MSAPTKRQLAARHVTRLRTIRKNLLEMSVQWEDIAQFYVNELEGLADRVEEVAVSLVDDGGPGE